MQRLMQLPAGHQVSSFKAACVVVLVSIRDMHGEVRAPKLVTAAFSTPIACQASGGFTACSRAA